MADESNFFAMGNFLSFECVMVLRSIMNWEKERWEEKWNVIKFFQLHFLKCEYEKILCEKKIYTNTNMKISFAHTFTVFSCRCEKKNSSFTSRHNFYFIFFTLYEFKIFSFNLKLEMWSNTLNFLFSFSLTDD